MNRRHFLFLSPLIVAGCSRSGSVTPVSPVVLAQSDARAAHLVALDAVKVPVGYSRTTPKPPEDLLARFPELKGVAKITMRLHPRFSEAPTPESSHLGGPFLWPPETPPPTSPNREALFPILQLRAEDAPPQFPFRPQTDLFQLFWNPRFRDQQPRTDLGITAIWRASASATTVLAAPNFGGNIWPDYVPVPCRFAPERVIELPSWEILPKPMRDKILAWKPDAESLYRTSLSTAPGTKVGGFWPTTTETNPPACKTCSWGMDYLLSVGEREWTDETAARWRPVEDTTDLAARHAGLSLGPSAAVHVFVCRRCETWPVATVV
jgi:hypothetical protein